MHITTSVPVRAAARRRRVAVAAAAAVAFVLVASGCVVNGTWTPLALATPAPTVLTDVACVSDTWCLALGDGVQVWDGTTWSPRPAPGGYPGAIETVDCFAVDRCAAIEQREGPWFDLTFHLLLFEGTSWTEAPGLGDLGDGDPNMLSCGRDGCVVSDTWDRMITWDGTSVTVEQQLEDVFALNMDCVAIDDCLAIGAHTSHWDGTAWTEVAEGAPEASEVSTFLECAGRTDRCATVGSRWAGTWVAEAMVWDGAAWAEVALPVDDDTFFSGLSCADSFECVATTSGYPSGTTAVLAFIGDAWYVAPTPPGGPNAVHHAVSCLTQTCVAVGRGTPPGGGADAGIASRYDWTYP